MKNNVRPTDDEQFYRPKAEARELSYSATELEHRQQLTQSVVDNLAIIRAESAGLDLLAEKIASIATALRLLREMEQERGLKDDAA